MLYDVEYIDNTEELVGELLQLDYTTSRTAFKVGDVVRCAKLEAGGMLLENVETGRRDYAYNGDEYLHIGGEY